MTRDEQKDISEFVDRVVNSGEAAAMDVEADAIIRALFVRNPDAAYRMTMLAMALANNQLAPPASMTPIKDHRQPWISTLLKRRGTGRGRIIEG